MNLPKLVIAIGGTVPSHVEQFTYLGGAISPDASYEVDVNRRIKLATAVCILLI
jgi:hypothetical protein